MTPGIVYAHIRAVQDRIRRDHRTAEEHRQACQWASERCEDLAALVGRMALPPHDPDETADLLQRTSVTACDIEGLFSGRQYQPPPRRRLVTLAALHRLDLLIEDLDEAVRNALSDDSDEPGSRSPRVPPYR
jgi:hypothetical protein